MNIDLAGKNFIVTGSNTGIGRFTAETLVRRGAQVWFACRSRSKAQPVIDQIVSETGNKQVHFLELDLSSLAAVKKSANAFLALKVPLHVLINNAGLARVHGVTVDGFENTFGINHLGPFLFTLLLKPALKQDGPSRVVNVASRASERLRKFDFDTLREPYHGLIGMPEYQRSKLANVLFAKEIARRWKADGINSYALHPGVIASDIFRQLPWPVRPLFLSALKSVAEGSVASLRCATDPALASESGEYYGEDGRHRRASPLANDQALAEKLWALSEDFVRPFLA